MFDLIMAPGADTAALVSDTRALHWTLFSELTPPRFGYYAGHYRGEDFTCLRYYDVGVQGDDRVGTAWQFVAAEMEGLRPLVRQGLAGLDAARDLPSTILSPGDRLLYAIQFACTLLEQFLRIHPYVNGNGHVARAIVWATLCRYGYHLRNWPIDPRPGPPYLDLIVAYRDGNREPLERFLLQCIDPGERN